MAGILHRESEMSCGLQMADDRLSESGFRFKASPG
jgi:hypothetical protein